MQGRSGQIHVVVGGSDGHRPDHRIGGFIKGGCFECGFSKQEGRIGNGGGDIARSEELKRPEESGLS